MKIRRLGWAGLEVEAAGATAVIDLWEDAAPLEPFIGKLHEPLVPPVAEPGSVSLALVTHLHVDHADPAAIGRALAPDGVVLRPAPPIGDGLETIAQAGAEHGFGQADYDIRVVEPWETVEVGPFSATAIPAVDGFGDQQVSWILEADGQRIFHGGDSIFHGFWWLTAMRHGPIDAAFLPCNGAVCDFPHRQPPSPLGAVLDPEQAATAAHLLQARVAVPIHYGAIHKPPVYAQVDDPEGRFVRACEETGVAVRVMEVGEVLELEGVRV